MAVASFIIEKEAILSGSKRAKSEVVICRPSNRIKGLLLKPKVVTPLIKKAALSAPGSPDLWYEINPEILPASVFVIFEVGCFNSDTFKVESLL